MLQTTDTETAEKLAYGIKNAAGMLDLSEAFLRKEIRANRLKVKKFGARLLILNTDLQTYLKSKEDWQPTNSNGDQKSME